MKMLSLFTISYVPAAAIMPLDLLFKKIYIFYGEHSRFLESTADSQSRLCELVAWENSRMFFQTPDPVGFQSSPHVERGCLESWSNLEY